MALYKQRGSSVWSYEFEFKGQRYRETTKTTSKTVARDAFNARRREVELGFNGIKKREMPKTFSVAADEHLAAKEGNIAPSTFEILKRAISHLRPVFGKTLLIDISPAEIKKYKKDRLSSGASHRYVDMDLEALRAVLRRNGQWERVRPDVSFYRRDDEFGYELPEEDESRLLEECGRSISRGLRTVITIALCTGMRKSEIKHLRWNEVFLDGDTYLIVGVRKTRSGRRRRVPLNARAIAALSEWARHFPDRLPDHYVFPAEKYSLQPNGSASKVYRHDPTKPMNSWRVAWKACLKRCGIDMRFHDLRHTAVSRMLRAGIPLTTVASIVGWSPSTMYLMAKRYAHILQPEMRKAVAVLEGTSHKTSRKRPASSPTEAERSATLNSRYDREELYEKVWKVPIRILAREYGVSDVALAKTCKRLHVPMPGRGYWAKKAAQQPVPARPTLPNISSGLPSALTSTADVAEGKKKPVESEKPKSQKKTA
jgi:integrase